MLLDGEVVLWGLLCVCVIGGGDFGVTAVRTPHTVHICIHVIML